jgi:hypothetical protein
MTQTFEILNFGHCYLFEIWDLFFVISILYITLSTTVFMGRSKYMVP